MEGWGSQGIHDRIEPQRAQRFPLRPLRPLRFNLLAPRWHDTIHPRIRDQLPEMLVQIIRHRKRRFDDRVITTEQLP